MQYYVTALTILFCTLLLRTQATAQNNDTTYENEVPNYTNIKEGKLSNGLTYYILKIDNTDKLLISLVVNAGYNQEEQDQYELSHLIEHMPFAQTEHLVNPREHFTSRGLRYGIDINAHTESNLTQYYLELPSQNKALVNEGLQFLRDCAGGLPLHQDKIDIERGVVLSELRRSNGMASDLWEQHLPYILNDRAYQHISTAERKENLRTFKRESLLNYYKKWYVPNNEALFIIGNIKEDNIENQIKDLFSDLKASHNLPDHQVESPIFLTDLNAAVITHKDLIDFSLEIHIKNQYHTIKTKTDIQRSIVGNLYSLMALERMKNLEREYSNAQFSSDFIHRFSSIGPNFSDLYTSVKTQNQDEILSLFKQTAIELQRIKKFGFSKLEVSKAKIKFAERFTSAANIDLKKIAADLAASYTTNAIVAEPEVMKTIIAEILAGMTDTDINKQIQQLLSGISTTIILDTPPISKGPSKEILTDIWIAACSADLDPYQEKAQNLHFDTEKIRRSLPVSPIYDKEHINKIDADRYRLKNGVTVIFKNTSSESSDQRTYLFGVNPGGSSSLTSEQKTAASIAIPLVWESGIGSVTGADLQEILNTKGIIQFPYISEFDAGIYCSFEPEHLTTVLESIHELILKPTFSAAQLLKIVDRKKNELIADERSAFRIFNKKINQEMNGIHLDSTTQIQALNTINTEMCQNVFKYIFSNSGNFTYIITGPAITEEMRSTTIQYLSDLPEAKQSIKPNYPKPYIARNKNMIIKAGEDSDIGLVVIKIKDTYNYSVENNQMLALFEILLKKHLTKALRSDLGGTYEVNIHLTAERQKTGVFTFTISFECSPQSSEQLKNATLVILKKLKDKKWITKELDDAKEIETNRLTLKMKETSFWLPYLKNQIISDRSLEEIADAQGITKNITTNTFHRRGNDFFNKANINIFQLRPQAK